MTMEIILGKFQEHKTELMNDFTKESLSTEEAQ